MQKVAVLLLLLFVMSCKTPAVEQNQITEIPFKYWTWLTADSSESMAYYNTLFRRLKRNGIDAVLINTHANVQLLETITRTALAADLEVHAWLMAMNRPGDSVALEHPDWYAVSRDGKSCHDIRPYVDYYQWLCPTRKASRNHVLSLVKGLSEVEGVASVHLDYIRYSDVFLPIGLLPKYDLIQDEELPEFDFCYCESCISAFVQLHHKNPLETYNPALDLEWKQFRLNQIKAVVDDAYTIAHKHNKKLTAAVFPYPEMAAQMVRQRWDKWHVDEVLPMIYHNFYNEELDWIGYATKQGVKDLEGTGIKLHTGVFLPEIASSELEKVINLARESGASGLAFFNASALTEEHLAVIKSTKNQ